MWQSPQEATSQNQQQPEANQNNSGPEPVPSVSTNNSNENPFQAASPQSSPMQSKNPFQQRASAPSKYQNQYEEEKKELVQNPYSSGHQKTPQPFQPANPYEKLSIEKPKRPSGGMIYQSVADPFAQLDTSPLKQASKNLAASANKTKSNLWKLLDSTNSQINKVIQQTYQTNSSQQSNNDNSESEPQSTQTPTKTRKSLLFPALQNISLTKTKSTPSGNSEQLTPLQNPKNQLGHGSDSTDTKINQLRSLQGTRIDDNPGERDVFLQCPVCEADVFDAGLIDTVRCARCSYQFTTEADRAHLNSELRVEDNTNNDNQILLREKQKVKREHHSAFDQDDFIVLNDKQLFQYEESKNECAGNQSNQTEKSNLVGGNRASLPINRQSKSGKSNQNVVYPHSSISEGSSDYSSSDNLNRNTTNNLEQSDSDSDQQPDDEESKESKQLKPHSKSGTTQLQSEQLIRLNSTGEENSSVFQNRTGPQISATEQSTGSQPSQLDSSSAYVGELESVLLFVNKSTVLDDFLLKPQDPLPSSPSQPHQASPEREVDFTFLLEKVLLPFFQLRVRILEKQTYFNIGAIEFYIAATSPSDFGKVTASTSIKLTHSIDRSQPLEHIILIPLKRLPANFSTREEMLTTTLQPFFQKNIGRCLHKNQVVELDEEHEFFVRYARPFFGMIQQGTNVNIDAAVPKSIRMVRVAPIWARQDEYEHACKEKVQVLRFLREQILVPYFQGGLLQVYLEKGETLDIFQNRFFINDCQPRQGIVDYQTVIELEVGFTQETFNKKQVLADQRMAERMVLQQQQLDNSALYENQQFHRTSSSHSGSGAGGSQRPQDRQIATQQQSSTNPRNSWSTELRGELLRAAFSSSIASLRHQQRHSNSSQSAFDEEDDRTTQEFIQQLLASQPGSNSSANELHHHFYHSHQGHSHGNDDYHQSSGSSGLSRTASRKATPKSIVSTLPKRKITQQEIDKNIAKLQASDSTGENDAGLTSCQVCLADYEDGEELRTMPCLHYFHRRCIDKWLLERASTCPICKFNIKQDYNITSIDQQTGSSGQASRHNHNNYDHDF